MKKIQIFWNVESEVYKTPKFINRIVSRSQLDITVLEVSAAEKNTFKQIKAL